MGKRRLPRSRRSEEPGSFCQSGLFRFLSRLMLGVVVIVIFLTLAQCTVKKPEAPEWNTTFVVPVIYRTYDMEELIRRIDHDGISIDTSGGVVFSITEHLDTFGLTSDDFALASLSYTLVEELAPLFIDSPAPVNAVIDLSELVSGFGTAPGFDTVIIPANSLIEATVDRQFETYSWAQIATGGLKIVVINGLGFTLHDVIVSVLDNSDSHIIDNAVLGTPLANGATDSVVLSLNGETITNDLRFTVAGRSDPVAEVRVGPNGKRITLNASFSESIEIHSAQAKIPYQDDAPFSQKHGLILSPGETIDSAQLEAGTFNLTITNNTPLSVEFDISTPAIHSNGNPFTVTRTVASGQTDLVNADLAGYTLTPDSDSLGINVLAGIAGSGDALVIINGDEQLSAEVQLTNLTFSRVSGIMANSSIEFNGIQQDVDIPDGFDNISLVTAVITVEIENGVDMPGYLNLTITGDNGKAIDISGEIEPCGAEPVRVTAISSNQAADFLTPLPQTIYVSGSVMYGDVSYHGTVERDDFVSARVHLFAPFEVRVNNAELSDLDIETETIKQDDIDIITDHVVSTRFIYSITNHLPLGVTAIVSLSNDTASLFMSPLLEIDTLRADPAPVSLATGIATGAAVSSGEIYLSNEDVQILKNDTLFIRPRIFLNASDTSGVKLTENDYITVSGRIEVVYRFDGSF